MPAKNELLDPVPHLTPKVRELTIPPEPKGQQVDKRACGTGHMYAQRRYHAHER